MHRFLIVIMVLIGLGLVGTKSVAADPVTFTNVAALQNDGATQVNLLSNPGVTLTGPEITFLADITGTVTPGVPTFLRVTYLESGNAPNVQNFQIPAFGTIPPPFTQLFTFSSPGANFQGVDAQLTLEILETGIKQSTAIALYESVGFNRIECYGDYASDDSSVCFEKRLIP